MKTIKTNKGTFSVRHVYESFGCKLVVIIDKDNKKPFTGFYGDEIHMTEDLIKQYDITVLD